MIDIKKRIKEILTAEAEAIQSVEVTDAFSETVQLLFNCKGKVVTTGIGKAGHIANKFAATLCSGTTPAVFMHPAEAAHGDLGLLDKQDIVIAFSTSGKSREVLEILELSRHLGVASIIGVTSHSDSPIRELSDIILDMGSIEEPCPLGLTPSATVAVMLAISDAIALSLMEIKGVTREEFGLRHHGGYLGRKVRLKNT
ncbi:UNVERIFIED_CONTAM: hypothetical protein GTU68_063437 [Idotea baltica]|nr:hypothetical protein [Idotea baltica]